MIQKANCQYETLLRTCSAPPHSFEATSTTLLRQKDTLITSHDTRPLVTHSKSLEIVCWTRHERFRASAGIKKGSDERSWVEIKKQLIAFPLAQNSRLMGQTRWSPGQRESEGQSGSQCPPFCLLNLNRKIYLKNLLFFFYRSGSNETEIFSLIHFVSSPALAVHSQSISLPTPHHTTPLFLL